MAQHAAINPHRVGHKPREPGAAAGHVHHERRHKSMEGKYGYIGKGATIVGATVQTGAGGGDPNNYFPGIVYNASGLFAYNSGGTLTMQISAADGSITVFGSGTITGSVIQTSATNPRTVMDSSGIRSYDALGNNTFNLAGGSLTVSGTSTITGGIIQTGVSNPRVIMDSSGLRAYNNIGTQTVNIGSDGSFLLNTTAASITLSASGGISISSVPSTVTGARVVLTALGIQGYNASNQQEFNLDATSGLITATGVIQANPGSTVPWQTTGFYVGGGNTLSNASAEDPTTTSQVLYTSTGTGVTAGTFTLRYGSNTVTSALNWNATAAQVQTALQATGVLPAGFGVLCSGGPLPGTPITITLSGTPSPAPTVIAVATQSLTGGSAIVGPLPFNWAAASGVLDWISYPSAFHGGQIFRLTAASSAASMVQTDGPYGLVAGTAYTLSAYFSAPTATRSGQLTLTWQDGAGNTVATSTVTAAWTTTTNWQRLYLTQSVPVAATRQQISITGSPTGGSFTLTYNGQTTQGISWAASAAVVLSKLQLLSNVGSSGVAYATGGPLPGTPVVVSFVSPPAAAPATMTATSSLTGGTSPAINITNQPAINIQSTVGIFQPTSGEIFYVDAAQLEVGDAPTGYKPRADEILAYKVTANMINVAQLSAITANLGTVTAGTINGVSIVGVTITGTTSITGATITGSTIQTASSGSRVQIDSSNKIQIFDSSNTLIVLIDPTDGINLTGGTSTVNQITWYTTVGSGASEVAGIYAFSGADGNQIEMFTEAGAGTAGTLGIQSATYPAVFASVGSNTVFLIDSDGDSSFARVAGTQILMQLWGQSLVSLSIAGGGTSSFTISDTLWNLGGAGFNWWQNVGYLDGTNSDFVTWGTSGHTTTAITFFAHNYGGSTASPNFDLVLITGSASTL